MHARLSSKTYVGIDIAAMKPLYDQMLVQLREKESAGSIVLPKGEETECRFGEILALGPGERSLEDGKIYPLALSVGQQIITMGHCGVEFKYEGKKYRIIKNVDVWATCKFDGKEITDLEPYGDHLIVRMRTIDQTQGGILLTANQQKYECTTAEVLRVGGGLRNMVTGEYHPPCARVGDILQVFRYAGAEVKPAGETEKLRIIQEQDILATEVAV